MSESNLKLKITRLKKENGQAVNRKKVGLLFGLLAGISFAIGAYGMDAVILVSSNGMYPFLRFIPALILCSLIGMLAGFLSGFIDQLLVNALIWGLAGFALSKITGYLVINWPNLFFEKFHPELLSLTNYVSNAGLETRLNLMTIIVTLFGIGAGLLYSTLLDESSTSGYQFKRFAPMLIWGIAFLIVAFVGDSILNQPLRSPLRTLDNMIQYQLDHEAEGIDDQTVRDLHLRALRAVTDMLDRPRKLLIKDFDVMMITVNVLVDFDGTWVNCSMLNSQGGTCKVLE